MKVIATKIETNGTTDFLTLHFLRPFSLTEKETYDLMLMSKDQPIGFSHCFNLQVKQVVETLDHKLLKATYILNLVTRHFDLKTSIRANRCPREGLVISNQSTGRMNSNTKSIDKLGKIPEGQITSLIY